MNIEHFSEAIQIVSAYHSSLLRINKPKNSFVGNLGATEFRLHIVECVPAVVDSLVKAGFALSMTPDGLLVERY